MGQGRRGQEARRLHARPAHQVIAGRRVKSRVQQQRALLCWRRPASLLLPPLLEEEARGRQVQGVEAQAQGCRWGPQGQAAAPGEAGVPGGGGGARCQQRHRRRYDRGQVHAPPAAGLPVTPGARHVPHPELTWHGGGGGGPGCRRGTSPAVLGGEGGGGQVKGRGWGCQESRVAVNPRDPRPPLLLLVFLLLPLLLLLLVPVAAPGLAAARGRPGPHEARLGDYPRPRAAGPRRSKSCTRIQRAKKEGEPKARPSSRGRGRGRVGCCCTYLFISKGRAYTVRATSVP